MNAPPRQSTMIALKESVASLKVMFLELDHSNRDALTRFNGSHNWLTQEEFRRTNWFANWLDHTLASRAKGGTTDGSELEAVRSMPLPLAESVWSADTDTEIALTALPELTQTPTIDEFFDPIAWPLDKQITVPLGFASFAMVLQVYCLGRVMQL
ncbi:hypothetical protein HDU93_001517, partial [Gonapodya sp. JEL0774]